MIVLLEDLNKFEIWDAKVEFEDEPGKSKTRPVLIDSDGDMYILAYKITGTPPRPNFTGEYSIKFWKEAGLKKPSTVRLNRIVNIPKENLIRYRGHLQLIDVRQVIKILNNIK